MTEGREQRRDGSNSLIGGWQWLRSCRHVKHLGWKTRGFQSMPVNLSHKDIRAQCVRFYSKISMYCFGFTLVKMHWAEFELLTNKILEKGLYELIVGNTKRCYWKHSRFIISPVDIDLLLHAGEKSTQTYLFRVLHIVSTFQFTSYPAFLPSCPCNQLISLTWLSHPSTRLLLILMFTQQHLHNLESPEVNWTSLIFCL